MQYFIHENLFADVEKKLNRIAKKCQKHNNDFTFNIVGEEMREDENNKGNFHKFIIVDVEGIAQINNWEFVAVLDIHKEGNIIRRYNNDIDVPEYFLHSDNVCEHCNTKRNRKSLYLIHNTNTNEFKQVGSDCLNLYTRGLDMECVAAYIYGVTELENNSGIFYRSGDKYFTVSELISLASIIINKVGYFNSKHSGITTKYMLSTMLRTDVFCSTIDKRVSMLNKELKAHGITTSFSVSDFIIDNTKEVNNIIDYYMSCNNNNEFINNVQIMLKEEYVQYKYIGYIAYLPMGYAKHIEKEIERAKKHIAKDEYFGDIKKRYKNIAVQSVKLITQYVTDYGVSRIWEIITDDNFALMWRTGNEVLEDCTKIDFTIKEHKEYNNRKQTWVTRCKLYN